MNAIGVVMIAIVLSLFACTPPSGEINTDGVQPTDTAKDTSSEEPDPQPDLSLWIGERTFITDDCEESATEEGYELTAEIWDSYEETLDKCPNCDRIYYVVVSPEIVCNYPVTEVRYRGVDFMEDGRAAVYNFSDWSGAEILDPDATFDGWTLNYAYDHNARLSMRGVVEYPEAEQE